MTFNSELTRKLESRKEDLDFSVGVGSTESQSSPNGIQRQIDPPPSFWKAGMFALEYSNDGSRLAWKRFLRLPANPTGPINRGTTSLRAP